MSSPTERKNWGQIMQQLSEIGYSTRRIAMILNVPASRVQQLNRNHEPRHWFGEAILELHEKRYILLRHQHTTIASS